MEMVTLNRICIINSSSIRMTWVVFGKITQTKIVCVCVCVWVCACACVCIYIYIERERGRERETHTHTHTHTHVCIHTDTYIYIYEGHSIDKWNFGGNDDVPDKISMLLLVENSIQNSIIPT